MQTDAVISNFVALSAVPRRSHHENQIGDWLYAQAKKRGFAVMKDPCGNVWFDVPATKGLDHLPKTALQVHMDMVAAVAEGVAHNWEKDPVTVEMYEDAGEKWLRSLGNRTSLGSDDGIGIALALAIADGVVPHGEIRIIVTVDEEDTQTGAKNLAEEFYRDIAYMINVDSETDGEVTISSAAGDDETIVAHPEGCAPVKATAYKIALTGFRGGHSGADIDKGRANAITALAKTIRKLCNAGVNAEFASFDGGSAPNAIPTSARAVVIIDEAEKKALGRVLTEALAEIAAVETNAQLVAEKTEMPSAIPTVAWRNRALEFLCDVADGVHTMSETVPGLVESSSNLGIATVTSDTISFKISTRTSVDAKGAEILAGHKALAEKCVFDWSCIRGCEPWPADPANPLVPVATNAWREITGGEMAVVATHAGLECGIFKNRAPQMNLVSIGPTIIGPHTVDEKCLVASVKRNLLALGRMLVTLPVTPRVGTRAPLLRPR